MNAHLAALRYLRWAAGERLDRLGGRERGVSVVHDGEKDGRHKHERVVDDSDGGVAQLLREGAPEVQPDEAQEACGLVRRRRAGDDSGGPGHWHSRCETLLPQPKEIARAELGV